ncbi:MAG: hypothetical protein K0R67_40 [Paenibacillus sp.]|jgi:hypothetical protein|nr:hypothetical protein [Paenibacillus sp.]
MLKRTIRRAAIPVILLLTVSVTGCGTKPTTNNDPTNASTPAPVTTPTVKPSVTPSPTPAETKINVYYADTQMTKLVEKQATLTNVTDTDKYKTALVKLQTVPDASVVSLFKGVNILSAQLKDGLVTVDVSIVDTGRLGAPGEAFLLDALKKTLFQFSEVKTIELLVDGKKTETLMGHMDIPHPIKR